MQNEHLLENVQNSIKQVSNSGETTNKQNIPPPPAPTTLLLEQKKYKGKRFLLPL